MAEIILHASRDKSLHRRHPWVFSGAVARIKGNPAPGETVDIRGSDGAFLGKGAYSPSSKIRVRVWSFEADETIAPAFFRRRLERAVAARAAFLKDPSSACRLVNAESDGLPGLILDRYGEYIIGQFLTVGAEHWKDAIVSVLNEVVPSRGIFERSDADARSKEGLPQRVGHLSGQEPPEVIEIREGAYRFLVDVRKGHKTGFYLDQRDNRAAVEPFASGARVLNCFSYTGGFAVAAFKAGATSVVNVDSSADALSLAKRNIAINGAGAADAQCIEGDAFEVLRAFREEGRVFDAIILDPPKFAESRQHLDRASRGYKDINLLAFKLLRPEGILMTFSCSGLMTRDLFEKTVAWAAMDAGRDVQILRRLDQACDHPTLLSFPEASYLKGLICRVC